jgi:hypothetical protein
MVFNIINPLFLKCKSTKNATPKHHPGFSGFAKESGRSS